MHDMIADNWNVGRGRRSPYKAMDFLLMLLTTMKHGGTRDVPGKMFGVNDNTFEKTILKFQLIISPHIYAMFVENVTSKYTWSKLNEDNSLFTTFNFAIDAVDVTFQQSNRPFGNHTNLKFIIRVNIIYTGTNLNCPFVPTDSHRMLASILQVRWLI